MQGKVMSVIYWPQKRLMLVCILMFCSIMKTYPCNIYPLKPHFYIAKLGYTGVYLFFLFLLQNIDCGYLLEPPRRGGSNVYPQSMFWAKIRKIPKIFCSFQFLQLKKNLYITWACFRNGVKETNLIPRNKLASLFQTGTKSTCM